MNEKSKEQLLKNDEWLRNACENKEYLYIDGLFVVNDPKYVYEYLGTPRLTNYALERVNECCLVFDRRIESNKFNDGSAYTLYNALNLGNYIELSLSESSKVSKTLLEVSEKERQDFAKGLAKVIKQGIDLDNIFITLPSTFNATLIKHMERKGVSEVELANDSGLSDNAIRAYCNSKTKRPHLRNVVALCAALCLHPVFAHDLTQLHV